jgi:hypothetical protein
MRYGLRGPRGTEEIDTRRAPGVHEDTMRFKSVASAVEHLRTLAVDTDNIRVLRNVGCEALGAPVDRLTDPQVLDLVASALVSGALRLTPAQSRPRYSFTFASASAAPAESPEPPPPPPKSPEPAPAPVTKSPVSAPTDPAVQDQQDRQAATLVRAAKEGTPFCEECEKRRRRSAA